MINKKCKVGKKTMAARRIAAILMTSTLAGTLAAGVPATIQISAASYSTNADYIFECLTKKLGFNEAAACGIMANIRCESTFNPHAWNAGGGSYGLCQWTGGRYGRLQSWCRSNGYDYSTIDGQLAYLQYELKNYYSGVDAYLRSVPNTADGAYDAGQYYCYHFEAPASRGSVSHYRGGLASGTFWETYRPAEWYQIDGKWRYLKRDGSYHTSWLTIDNKTYYLDENGYRVSSWKTIDGIRYYFDKNGVMATGWVKIDGKNYYFDEEGCLITGLVQNGGDWYLVNQDGEIKTSNEMGDFAQAWVPTQKDPDETSLASADDQKSTSSDNNKSSAASAADSKDVPVNIANGLAGVEFSGGTGRAASNDSSRDLADNTPNGVLIGGIQNSGKRASGASQSISIASLQKDFKAEEPADTAETEETVKTAVETVETEETAETAETSAAADTTVTADEAFETAEDAETTEAADETAESTSAADSADKAEDAATEDDADAAETETEDAAAEDDEEAAENEAGETRAEAEDAAAEDDVIAPEIEAEDAAADADEAEDAATEDETATAAEEDVDASVAEIVEEAPESSASVETAEEEIEEGNDADDAFAAADALRAAAAATEEADEEEIGSGFFNLYNPETSSIADTLPEIIQEAASSVSFTLKDNRIPPIKRSEMKDLVDILVEKNLLHAVAKDGKDITNDLEVTFEKVEGKNNVYKVTFTAEYQGEKTEFESQVTVTD